MLWMVENHWKRLPKLLVLLKKYGYTLASIKELDVEKQIKTDTNIGFWNVLNI